ncbi:MAG: PHP domain-containing protein [Clostridia bacterium]|nr:PHP domain-containing protein [Clostridia bacterium]
MKLLADLHTHSKYSGPFHGRSTIEQMAFAANEMGLVEIAITDHGYNHWCGTSLYKIAKARLEIDEINKWSKTKVLLGVEADIISEDGTLDIDSDTLEIIDILLIGYHRLIKTDFVNYFGKQKDTKEARERATNAFINAINKYPVTIVTHLDSILTTDLYRIGKACADKGVMVEINSRHCKWTEDQVNDLIASGCMFVVSSDAHRSEDVGAVKRAFNVIRKYNIPPNLIANVEFDEIEKSADDLEVEQYYSLYLARKKEKEEKEAALEEKKKTEFTDSLSDEMESKLREIAKEKGLEYKEKEKEPDLFEEYQKIKMVYGETEEIIKRAKEYLNEHALQEFDMQNLKVEGEDEFILDNLDEREPESKLEETKETAVIEEKPVVQAEPAKVEEVSSDEKILDIMQHRTQVVPAPSTPKPSVSAPQRGSTIVKNTAPAKPKVGARNGRSLESFMQSMKEEPKPEEPKKEEPKQKPVAKKGRGGVFIQIEGIGDDNK